MRTLNPKIMFFCLASLILGSGSGCLTADQPSDTSLTSNEATDSTKSTDAKTATNETASLTDIQALLGMLGSASGNGAGGQTDLGGLLTDPGSVGLHRRDIVVLALDALGSVPNLSQDQQDSLDLLGALIGHDWQSAEQSAAQMAIRGVTSLSGTTGN